VVLRRCLHSDPGERRNGVVHEPNHCEEAPYWVNFCQLFEQVGVEGGAS